MKKQVKRIVKRTAKYYIRRIITGIIIAALCGGSAYFAVVKDKAISVKEYVESLFQTSKNEISNNFSDAKTSLKNTDGILTVSYIDVGQGDSILLEQGNSSMLIDTGATESYDAVTTILNNAEISDLDYLCLTHMDSDHMQNANEIIADYDVDTVLCADNFDKDTVCVSELRDSLQCVNKTDYPKAGDTYSLGDAIITVVGPEINQEGAYSDSNDYSIMLKVSFGENDFLFTGDANGTETDLALDSGYDLSADVLKLAHHGSAQENANNERLISSVNPTYAIVSCSADNSYGHPHYETMQLMQNYGISLFRTDKQGTITATSDGTTISWDQEPCNDYSAGVNSTY